ncbi:MAG: hypothetical protein LC793_23365 [Thermomicrobia bacterium]|nr:hypothetical protein [Thermomicrobia bacterium]MCA1725486.1 hypothetical protein [Thermomicrobia bacterium]
MAISADLYLDRNIVGITLLLENRGSSIGDDIDVPGYTANAVTWWYWDSEKLMRGEREFLGIEVIDITLVTEADFAALDRLDLPTIDSPADGLFNVTIADALRWAQCHARELPARTAHVKAS